jgi:hypothetical protein
LADESPQSEQEAMAQLQEELRRLKVSDVLVQTVLTVSSLGFHKLEGETRDLDQARLAVDALKALVPTLAGSLPAEAVRDFNQMIANLQLAYAKAAADAQKAEPAAEPEPAGEPEPAAAPEPEGEPEPAAVDESEPVADG